MPITLPTEKFCKACSTTKPATAFSVVKRPYKGIVSYYLQSSCKPCMVIKSKRFNRGRTGYVRPARRKALNDNAELKLTKSPMSWEMQKRGVELSEYKVYPVCMEGHRYVGPTCLPCKYGVVVGTVA